MPKLISKPLNYDSSPANTLSIFMFQDLRAYELNCPLYVLSPSIPSTTLQFIQRQQVNINKGPCLLLQSIVNTAARARPLCSKPTNVSHFIQCKVKNLCDGPEGPYIVQPLADSHTTPPHSSLPASLFSLLLLKNGRCVPISRPLSQLFPLLRKVLPI